MKVGIIGSGHVGTAMHKLFKSAAIYDEPLGIGTREAINTCGISFVCVPTPPLPNGKCDTSIVEDVLSWVETPVIVLRSTVPVGFTDEMMIKTGKRIVFQPEYYGESVAHPFADLTYRPWLSFGGRTEDINYVVEAYQQVYNSNIDIHTADAKSVELAKYMENSFLALKVTFCNEMYGIAEAIGIDYNTVREIWLADPRMGRSHTFVYPKNRGYGGSCLPKDIRSIIFQAEEAGADTTLLRAMEEKNGFLQKKGNPAHGN